MRKGIMINTYSLKLLSLTTVFNYIITSLVSELFTKDGWPSQQPGVMNRITHEAESGLLNANFTQLS